MEREDARSRCAHVAGAGAAFDPRSSGVETTGTQTGHRDIGRRVSLVAETAAEQPAFRFSGERPGPHKSTAVRLIRPDDLPGHLGAQDRPHVSTTVVSTALAAGLCIRDPLTFRPSRRGVKVVRFKWPNAGEAALPGVWITCWRGGSRSGTPSRPHRQRRGPLDNQVAGMAS
jgi:hypothetical protein